MKNNNTSHCRQEKHPNELERRKKNIIKLFKARVFIRYLPSCTNSIPSTTEKTSQKNQQDNTY